MKDITFIFSADSTKSSSANWNHPMTFAHAHFSKCANVGAGHSSRRVNICAMQLTKDYYDLRSRNFIFIKSSVTGPAALPRES